MNDSKLSTKRVLLGGLMSATLLVIFIFLHNYGFKGLDLDVKWIAVCSIPILISFFLSGLIRSIKGYGLEIEATLEKPVKFDFVEGIKATETFGFTKSSMEFLYQLSSQEKLKVRKLTFVLRKENYYEDFAVGEYLRQLKNLVFIEITTVDGELRYLISSRSLVRRQGTELVPDNQKISRLITAIENDTILLKFPKAITKRIKESTSLIDAYQEFETTREGRTFNNQILPVVDSNKKMIGVIDKRTVEARIAHSVVEAVKN